MQGYGTFKAADGSRYQGGWANDLKHGLGKKFYSNGDKYDGIWKHGKPDGPGRYVWADGNEYNGEWKNGRMHGHGTFQWKTGERYDGEWKVRLIATCSTQSRKSVLSNTQTMTALKALCKRSLAGLHAVFVCCSPAGSSVSSSWCFTGCNSVHVHVVLHE